MNGPERAVWLLQFGVQPVRRGRFAEEWRADLVAARDLGIAPWEIAGAAFRVVVLLAWIGVCRYVCRSQDRVELGLVGCAVGVVVVVADLPVAAAVPFVVVVVLGWAWRRLVCWIDSGS